MQTKDLEQLKTVSGQKIKAATSSLSTFSAELENGVGVILDAAEVSGLPSISVRIVPASELPKDADAVCKVDWAWIYGSSIRDIQTGKGTVRFQLNPAGPLTVMTQFWQGKPFLAFQPYRAPQ